MLCTGDLSIIRPTILSETRSKIILVVLNNIWSSHGIIGRRKRGVLMSVPGQSSLWLSAGTMATVAPPSRTKRDTDSDTDTDTFPRDQNRSTTPLERRRGESFDYRPTLRMWICWNRPLLGGRKIRRIAAAFPLSRLPTYTHKRQRGSSSVAVWPRILFGIGIVIYFTPYSVFHACPFASISTEGKHVPSTHDLASNAGLPHSPETRGCLKIETAPKA